MQAGLPRIAICKCYSISHVSGPGLASKALDWLVNKVQLAEVLLSEHLRLVHTAVLRDSF